MKTAVVFALALSPLAAAAESQKPSISGIHPHLAMFNNEGECGTGAIVPWADRLWVVTYAPHMPRGSSDKLYEITPDLRQIVRPESIGGTPANRMIHPESDQLFIGPYAIDRQRQVRFIPYSEMFGRPTAIARHLSSPAEKLVLATMEEGIYEINAASLEVRELWADEQTETDRRKADLPGYHGKGFYSGQGVYVYANNGEHGSRAKTDPTIPSGVLAEWDGQKDDWAVVRRNQFTEVTGPGGIRGNPAPATDPIWTMGWDARSLLLGVRHADDGWRFFRLPKASHSYDGAHGWNTEWPRIREIGEQDLLMTMHGTFWRFPADFGGETFGGIRPRSNYLKVIGDFCRWRDRIVFGCDDTARNEFLNKRRAKGKIAAPQSQSNLWFVEPETLDRLGPAIGRGAVWLKEDLAAGTVSDPYLFAGYAKRGLHLHHESDGGREVHIEFLSPALEIAESRTIRVEGHRFLDLSDAPAHEWIRLGVDASVRGMTATFCYRNPDSRTEQASPIFDGLARAGEAAVGGLIRARSGGEKTLSLAALDADGAPSGYYELDADLALRRVNSSERDASTRKHTAIPASVVTRDQASAIYTDDDGNRWRLPRGDGRFGRHRIAREVATERDLLHVEGTFYELPARNAGGIAKVRPVTTHHRRVQDFCSYRGLLVMTGVSPDPPRGNRHLIRSDDGQTAVWVGAIDDIWQLGKPRGTGGPWKQTRVRAGVASDPYLMTGFDRKLLQLRFDDPANDNLHVTAQIDLHGDGTWIDYQRFFLEHGETIGHEFPDSFSAYWIRFVSDEDTTATAQLIYR